MVSQIWQWIKSQRSKLVVALIWLVLLGVVWGYINVRGLTVIQLVDEFRSLLVDRWYGPLIYIAVYLLRPVIVFPATWLTALAGILFGLPLGFAFALTGGTLSAIVPYFFGRWFGGDWQEKSEASETRIGRFIGLMHRNPFQSILTMRLLYIPYDAVSFVAGNLKIPFAPFMSATAIGNLSGTLVYVAIGASIEGDIANRSLSFNPALLVFSAVVLVSSLVISRMVNRWQAKRKSHDVGSEQVSPSEA